MNEVNIGKVTVFDHPEATKEQALKILEESAETVEAFKVWEKSGYDLFKKAALRDEIADTIQACANLIYALETTDFAYYMERCKNRNINRGRITVEEPEPELKPCPFCGSEAEPVFCGSCNYITCSNKEECWCGMTSPASTKEKAIKIWNTRAGEKDE